MACGIDFGTSNSALAVSLPQGVELLPVDGGHATLPTVMFFDDEAKATQFGRAAIARYIDGAPGRFMRALKSILGSSLAGERTIVQGKPMPFIEIISCFIAEMRREYEANWQQAAQSVVMGRPVRFVDESDERDAQAQDQLAQAAKLAGFTHVEFQYEPIAAALDYEQKVRGEELVLIADIGAGTSDFSLIRVAPERRLLPDRKADILSNGGVHIGGNDFDRALSLEAVMPSFGYHSRTRARNLVMPNSHFVDLATWHKIHFLYNPRIRREIEALWADAKQPHLLERYVELLEHHKGHEVNYAVEAAKIELSNETATCIDLSASFKNLKIEATRPQLEKSSAELIASILRALGDTVQAAGVAREDIAAMVFTGGAAQMPLLRSALQAELPLARLETVDAFSSVAQGLALEASRRFGLQA